MKAIWKTFVINQGINKYALMIAITNSRKYDFQTSFCQCFIIELLMKHKFCFVNLIGGLQRTSLYSLIWDILLSQIFIWTTTTWSNVWVVLPKRSWYEFLIGFLIWPPVSMYLHLTTFSNICVVLSMFLYL